MDSQIYLPQSEKLNIGYLSHAFDNKSECYKLFWFQAIIRKVAAGQTEITFDELVDDMIADAWYMVTEYHLNLGPRDNLEAAVWQGNMRSFVVAVIFAIVHGWYMESGDVGRDQHLFLFGRFC